LIDAAAAENANASSPKVSFLMGAIVPPCPPDGKMQA